MTTFAIIQTGGKQYQVKEGARLKIEKLEQSAGENVTFDKVLLRAEEGQVSVGTPFVEGESVEGKILNHGKAKKVIVFKYKPKKHEKKKKGHRQPYTLVEITRIGREREQIKEKEASTSARQSKRTSSKKSVKTREKST